MQVTIIAVTNSLLEQGGPEADSPQADSPEAVLVYAGRACYQSAPKGDPGRFLSARIREGHGSIIEHASVTFEVAGVSRSCSHQLVRHRIASYSQESQRYVDMVSPEFIVPPAVASDPEAVAAWDDCMDHIVSTYARLRGLGVRKEDARFVLPNATGTRIIVTMNFRTLRHFFSIRCQRASQWEIRHLALEMLRQVHEVAPSVFQDQVTEFLA